MTDVWTWMNQWHDDMSNMMFLGLEALCRFISSFRCSLICLLCCLFLARLYVFICLHLFFKRFFHNSRKGVHMCSSFILPVFSQLKMFIKLFRGTQSGSRKPEKDRPSGSSSCARLPDEKQQLCWNGVEMVLETRWKNVLEIKKNIFTLKQVWKA